MKFLSRLSIILSFLIYSCDETSEIGIDELLSNQKEKVKVHYIEIPLEVNNIYYDSVRTDDGDLYFGQINDPIFGNTKSTGYAQTLYQEGPDVTPIPGEYSENYYVPNDSSILDSAIIYLRLSKVFGENVNFEQEISVNQITDTLFSSALYTSSKYTPISFEDRGIIGFQRFKTINLDDNVLSIPVTDKYGNFILDQIISGKENYKLLDYMRGLALVPGENNNQLVSFDLDHQDSKMVLYFNNPVEFPGVNSPEMDSLQFVFRFNSPLAKHYSHYVVDRTSSELSIVESLKKNQDFSINNNIYWQSSSGIYPVIDLKNFETFLDSAQNIILNKAQIAIGPIDPFYNAVTPTKSLYYIADANNKINPIGIITNPNENMIMRDNSYFTDDNEPGEYLFDSNITFSYKGESTVFFQELASGNIDAKKLVVYPENSNSFEKLIIDKNKFYLKVFYTKLNQQ
ncbi:MAG: hypothetical protein CMB83_05785 [Flammeovirgaceae bacterium]|nr:hypothetical protein [Flammeovirgaceae bacterium]|tara:strand:+ start:2232 stop:3602 length:1371 start_codon:yes stop_codon:yes gene_type:complete